MFYQQNDADYRTPLEGIQYKTLVYGEKTLLAEFRLEKGKVLPLHDHPQEQSGYLVSGEIILTIGEERFAVKPGDSWSIPGNVPHGATIVEESVAIEVFSPVREDYLP